ncbi:HNH endonuclease signature motif containing protein [Nocardioides donggukensis]|uniref:HNH endonuclease n=1 Tax=Nocardioides donggukensis TaxID=2774019 RepID=A0A927K3V3_9ACTN|nr:HNH endonuclease signature motif containing protein [Nocardioides donggukensis]MBD8869674.1 HNH endonuclease [Nocardioides donggukensis]
MIEVDVTGQPIEVRDLDAEWLLELAEEAEQQSRASERRKLRYAAQWCALHPALPDGDASCWGEVADCDELLGGEGTPLVAAFTAEPFAAALGVSTRAGMALMADALELEHRLPAIWERVEALEVAPWRARRVAQATVTLSPEAAAHVDRCLAGIVDSCGPGRIDRAVAEAQALFDAEEQAEAEETARDSWSVRLTHGVGTTAGPLSRWVGTSFLEVIGDTQVLTDVHDLVCRRAAELGAAGDDDGLEVRKIRALGTIVDQAAGAAGEVDGAGGRSRSTLYLHADLADVLGDRVGTGTAERLGAATLERIRAWVGRGRVTVVPVLDRGRDDAVDGHDPPAWMRELVILRDRHCVFPWCERDARCCDVDHITPYDEHGPPGQTHPGNLAPLCRRHHRAKTARRWHYRRTPEGTFAWQGPHGRRFLVTPSGTVRLD